MEFSSLPVDGGDDGSWGPKLLTALGELRDAVNATQAQQDQLMTVTPTVDELTATQIITSWNTTNSAFSQQETAGANHTVWHAPFPLQIVQMTCSWDYFALAANDTNYLSINFARLRAGTYSQMVEKTTMVTGGEAITARTAWKFAGATWDMAAATMAEGDLLVMRTKFTPSTGSGITFSFPMTMTWRYVPL